MNLLTLAVIIFASVATVWSSPMVQKCADNTTCLVHETCCKGVDCCPMSNAVCCKDQAHCCPQGYECSEEGLLCEKPDATHVKKTPIQYSLPLRRLKKFFSKNAVQQEVCPDTTSICSDGDTCCKLESGMYGCCNLTDAICCADEVHCCPSGYTCSENEGQCYVRFGQHSQTVPANRKYKATHIGELIAKQTKDHECGTDAECQKNYSCCSVDEQGNYGCYKGKNAMCCADGKSWCPQGYTCNLSQGECNLIAISI